GAGAAIRPRLATHGGAVYVAWMEDVGSAKEVMFSRSLNGGASFSTPVNLSNSTGESPEARIAVGPARRIYGVWDEQDPTRHIALARSFDGGASFTNSTVAAVVRPIGNCPPDATTASCTAYPSIAVDQASGNVYVIWHDFVNASGVLQIVFSRS